MASRKTDATGPTVPRMALGHELEDLRERHGLSMKDVADILDCSLAKIRKMERGLQGTTQLELDELARRYEIDKAKHAELEDLRRKGAQRGWWAKYARYLRADQATLFGIETAAITIRSWEPYAMPGLLQTETYARTFIGTKAMNIAERERFVSIRMERQKLMRQRKRHLRFVIDEAVLHRSFGDMPALAEQLERLLDPPFEECMIQIIPLDAGHPGGNGAVTIFEFDTGLHTPIMYSETAAGGVYFEDDQVDTGRHLLDTLMATALDPSASQDLIRATIKNVA